MRPERHNAVKLLLFLDVGGSMDGRVVKLCEELFSAATTEFKNLEILLLPQLPVRGRVEGQSPPLRPSGRRLWDMLHKFGHDYKLVFVGDAAMSPYEISHPGGSVEHFNEEAGRGVDQPADHRLPGRGVAQPDARSALGLFGDPPASSAS